MNENLLCLSTATYSLGKHGPQVKVCRGNVNTGADGAGGWKVRVLESSPISQTTLENLPYQLICSSAVQA